MTMISAEAVSTREATHPAVKIPPVSFAYGNGRFELTRKGVFFMGKERDGSEQPPLWICSPLTISAKTRDEKNGQWGRLLEWQDDDRKIHQWAMPLDWLEGDGADVRRELAQRGLQISPTLNARSLLLAYIKTVPVEARQRCVDRLGWYGDIYVTPTGSIGCSDEKIVYQRAHFVEAAFSEKGTAADWRNEVAALAHGNSRPMFAISAAFAGPLANLINEDSGGFHFRGASSSGKSTCLNVAASVWGTPLQFVRQWRTTNNGLEGLASSHNDGILILDEISQADPHEVGNAAYLIANGQGKTRAARNGLALPPQRWRTLLLSAGEVSLASLMASAGKKSTAGQEIRLADIESDAGAGFGIFETLHGYPNGAALAAAIKTKIDSNFGAVGRAWLHIVVENRPEFRQRILSTIDQFTAAAVPQGAPGQVERVARRFALVAAAGELATEWGMTGWDKGDAFNSALTCSNSWLESFGCNGNREDRAIQAQTLAFLEEHGSSRFEDIRATSEQHIQNRAGYFRDCDYGIREYLVLPETFRRKFCQEHDPKAVVKALVAAGILIAGKDGRTTQTIRLPGVGPARVYVLRYKGDAQ